MVSQARLVARATAETPYCPYGFGTVKKGNVDALIAALLTALEARGFRLTSLTDLQELLRATGDVELPPYLILEVCHPGHAAMAYQAEPNSGLLLSCSIIVYADATSGGAVIMARDPAWVMDLLRHPAAIEAAMMIKVELENLIETL